jgi:hypothetical protein
LSSFLEVVDRAQALLESRGRVTLRGLRREFDLDDETLDDLVDALVEGQQVANRDGSALVWRGGTASTPPETPSETASADESPAPLPEPGAGERRQLTVMFCDLVGSTELAQRIDPEELREVLREYRSVCVEATKRFDGHIAQYLGDGVMVYFGYPLAHEDDAGRAVRAGLEIQRVLAERPDASRIEARIVLMRERVAEVDHHTIAEVLRDVSVEALGGFDADRAILAQDGPQLFGIDTLREFGRADKIAEHHRELSAFAGVWLGRRGIRDEGCRGARVIGRCGLGL